MTAHGGAVKRRGGLRGRSKIMIELVRTNDAVLISWLKAQLSDAGIDVLVLDEHMSIMDGSILAIPRRIMVPDGDAAEAQAILAEADRIAGGAGSET